MSEPRTMNDALAGKGGEELSELALRTRNDAAKRRLYRHDLAPILGKEDPFLVAIRVPTHREQVNALLQAHRYVAQFVESLKTEDARKRFEADADIEADAGAGRGDNLPRYPTKAERDRAERAHLESLIERAQRLTAETRETANALEEMRNSAAESRNRIRAAAERAEQIRATAPAEPVDTTPLVFPQDLDELRVFTERLRNEGPDVLRAEQRAAREALNPPDGGARGGGIVPRRSELDRIVADTRRAHPEASAEDVSAIRWVRDAQGNYHFVSAMDADHQALLARLERQGVQVPAQTKENRHLRGHFFRDENGQWHSTDMNGQDGPLPTANVGGL